MKENCQIVCNYVSGVGHCWYFFPHFQSISMNFDGYKNSNSYQFIWVLAIFKIFVKLDDSLFLHAAQMRIKI